MNIEPLYTGRNIKPAYQLRYGWIGWPSRDYHFPKYPSQELLDYLVPEWEKDGMRLLEYRWSIKEILMTFSVTPSVSPVFFASRVKGRLQHTMKKTGKYVKFSRKIAVRSIGDSNRKKIEFYIANQLNKVSLADPRYEKLLRKYSFTDPAIDLSQPTITSKGRYWYNIHLVLVVPNRFRIGSEVVFRKINRTILLIAKKKGYAISSFFIMPDHLHVSLRGNITHSPLDIALFFQNNLA